jgi:hypothetical protein
MLLSNLPGQPLAPLHPQHDAFETEVTQWLTAMGFLCHSATYHTMMPPAMANLLRRRSSMTALHLRGRADRIAIHQTLPVEFEYECKTHDSQQYQDLTIELTALCFHLMKARLGVKCLYIYRHNGREKGFWADEMPTPRVVHIPARYDAATTLQFKGMAENYFPNVPIRLGGKTNGSGDPFVIIDYSVVAQMANWRELVGVLMER